MNDRRRALPAVTALLAEAERSGLATRVPRATLVRSIREALSAARGSGDVQDGGNAVGRHGLPMA